VTCFVFVLEYFQGTQIEATLLNDVARKFCDKFVMGKVYYISKAAVVFDYKYRNTVPNGYKMRLYENSEVEEVANEAAFVPNIKYNFVPLDQLGPHANQHDLVGEYCLEVVLPLCLFLLL